MARVKQKCSAQLGYNDSCFVYVGIDGVAARKLKQTSAFGAWVSAVILILKIPVLGLYGIFH